MHISTPDHEAAWNYRKSVVLVRLPSIQDLVMPLTGQFYNPENLLQLLLL